MNVSFNPTYSVCNSISKSAEKQSNPAADVCFCGNPFKKLAPFAFSTLAVIGALNMCSEESAPRYSGSENKNGVNVEYYDVTQQTKDSVMKPIYELKDKLNAENDFIDGVDYTIAKNFGIVLKKDSFKKYLTTLSEDSHIMGTSFYSDGKLPKNVAVNEDAHKRSKIYDASGNLTTIPALRFTVMHETGHHFDNYFGHDCDADFAQKYDSLMASKLNAETESPYAFQTISMSDKKIDIEYNRKNGLSDKEGFKKAFLNDLKNLHKISKDERPHNINYYIDGLNIGGQIKEQDVDFSDVCRAEAYATLFAYANKQDDGEKAKFLKCFPNSYKVVREDIAKYLGE